jgi:hypothetical protein
LSDLLKIGDIKMDLHCTKKMLDQLQVRTKESDGESESLFTWHVNLMTVNRRNTVVLVNDSNRYCVVLYGLKKKDFQSFGTLVQTAIRNVFLEEGISEEVVDRYLDQAGSVKILKSKNRQTTSWINKACEAVSFWGPRIQDDSLINCGYSLRVSRDIVGIVTGEYFKPHEKMVEDLEGFVGHPIFKRRAAVLTIRLKLENKPVWRRIVVPLEYSFYKIHRVIQASFGWMDSHLHEFMIYSADGGDEPVALLVNGEEAFDFDYGIPMKWDTEARLSDYLPTRVVYTYDLGDNWEHEIVVEEILDAYDQPFPVCLDGQGDRPPEDVGGESGYEHFLEIMADPAHPEHESMKQWVGGQWDLKFDQKHVNHRLRDL